MKIGLDSFMLSISNNNNCVYSLTEQVRHPLRLQPIVFIIVRIYNENQREIVIGWYARMCKKSVLTTCLLCEEPYEILSRLLWTCPYNVFFLQQVTNYLQLQIPSSLALKVHVALRLFVMVHWLFFCLYLHGYDYGFYRQNMNWSHMFLSQVFVISPMTLVGTFIPYSLNVSNMA